MIDEQISTTFREWPAVRSGAGAEVNCLMWQLPDSSGVGISCDDEDAVDRAATVVRKQASDLLLPLDLNALPDGYGVSAIHQAIDTETRVYVEKLGATPNDPDSDLEISHGTGERAGQPTGRSTTVNGPAAMLSEDPRSPSVCVLTKPSPVCVSVYTSDTGPYPDRSAEISVLLQIAESLRFPKDLGDDSNWFPPPRSLADPIAAPFATSGAD